MCGGKVPSGRHKFGGAYCGEMCEKKVEGYSPSHTNFLEKVSAEVNASTAWTPIALEPVVNLKCESALVMSDLHCPLHDPIWTQRAIDAGVHFGCKDVILNGDVMDLNAISKHAGSYWRRGQELEDDMRAAEVIIAHLCQKFERIWWISGNHDTDRLVRAFKGEIQAQRLLQMVGKQANLKITVRSYMDVNETIRVCHPRQYSKIRGKMTQDLSQRWQKTIVAGHLHHSASTQSPCGRFQAIEVPGLQKTDIQDYIRNELNTMPEPCNGFAVIVGELVQVFDKFTPWKLFGLPEL